MFIWCLCLLTHFFRVKACCSCAGCTAREVVMRRHQNITHKYSSRCHFWVVNIKVQWSQESWNKASTPEEVTLIHKITNVHLNVNSLWEQSVWHVIQVLSMKSFMFSPHQFCLFLFSLSHQLLPWVSGHLRGGSCSLTSLSDLLFVQTASNKKGSLFFHWCLASSLLTRDPPPWYIPCLCKLVIFSFFF